jgi:hypothetical protein
MEEFMAPSNRNHLNREPGHRYSDEERAALLRGIEQFGGSLYAYSKKTGVTMLTLQRWLRGDSQAVVSGLAGSFVEMEVRHTESSFSNLIEMELAGAIRLRFPPLTDPAYIGRLVRELGA